MRPPGKPCRLTGEQAEQLVREYQLGKELTPSKLARKYGISHTALQAYVRGSHKVGPRRLAGLPGSDTGTPK